MGNNFQRDFRARRLSRRVDRVRAAECGLALLRHIRYKALIINILQGFNPHVKGRFGSGSQATFRGRFATGERWLVEGEV